jgi:hypothetical protein
MDSYAIFSFQFPEGFEIKARAFPLTSGFTTDFGHFADRTVETISAALRFNSWIDSSE